MTTGLEHPQRFAAACPLQSAATVAKTKCITDPIGELSPACDALQTRTVDHIVKSGKIGPQAATDFVLSLHPTHGSAGAS